MTGGCSRWWRGRLRHPAVHCVLLGALLFTLRGEWSEAHGAPERDVVVIDAAAVDALRAEFRDRWGAPPTDAQLQAAIAQRVEEEMLYREAQRLALGLGDGSVRRRLLEKARAVSRGVGRTEDDLVDEALTLGLDDDVVIRRLLAQKMRLVLEAEGGTPPITEADLADYLARHRQDFVLPETVTFTHAFFATRPGTRTTDRAAEAVRACGESPSPACLLARSDPFPLGHHLHAYTREQVQARFGQAFADAVAGLQPGAWSPPLRSPFGVHLVRIESRQPERMPPLDAVRDRIVLALTAERAAANLARGLARLRELYRVEIAASTSG